MEYVLLAGLAATALSLMFAPALLATVRGHRSWMAISAVCLFFGWTVVGWVVALVWSLGDTGRYR